MNAVQQVEKTWDDRPAPQVSESSAVIAMIERASRDPAVDIDKFERLMRMHQEVQDRRDKELAAQARRAFNAAMVETQSMLPQVVRNAENTQTRSVYATMDAIGEAIDPIITANGFTQSFGFADCPKENHYRIICRTAHRDGHEQIDHLDMPIDNAGPNGTVNKTKPHALSSTASYARRILTCLIFNVKTRKGMPDDDGNAAGSGEMIDSEQFGTLTALIDETKANKEIFLKYFRIGQLADLPASEFARAVKKLEAKRVA